MFFSSFAEFIDMGGHGQFVWLSYGLALLIIGYNVAQPLLKRRQLVKQLQQVQRRETRRAS